MANRIRRHSMENLVLYDIDQLNSMKSSPPPIPPPRKYRQHLPERFAFERYRFLCDMQRHLTDPIYAATPMFTTILPTVKIKSPRRALGVRIPNEIIKARTPSATSSSDSSESTDTDNQSKDKSSDEDDEKDDNQDSDNDNSGGGDQSSSSSSSSSTDDDDDDINNDDDDNQGIVEQIFNRDRK